MVKNSSGIYFLILLLAFGSFHAAAEMVITHRAPETDSDTRPNYEISLLRLALEKTLDEYGPYRLQSAPRINMTRSVYSIRTNSFPNYFYSLGYEEMYNSYPEMTYVRFPIDLGVLGYRTCFIPKNMQEKIAKINSLDELRKLSIGQGRGWVDSEILRSNGFNVIEIEQYDALFKMTAVHRFDLFCRGASEIKDEYEHWKDLKNLGYDQHLLIHYPLPIFLYTNSANQLAVERITKGLKKAYADGSLYTLWAKQHQNSLDFAQLNNRKLFNLQNPLLKSIDLDYEKYQFTIGSEPGSTYRLVNTHP